tara:strand:+ start:4692 stop:5009 length:318 start_codon:yes stop_codon:yes gene_type:complete
MASLTTKIELYLGRTPDFLDEVQVFGDNGVETINVWNCKDKPKPTKSQLDAFEKQAEVIEKNKESINKRMSEYGTIEKQIEYITENGLTKWQENVTTIKKKYPKE